MRKNETTTVLYKKMTELDLNEMCETIKSGGKKGGRWPW